MNEAEQEQAGDEYPEGRVIRDDGLGVRIPVLADEGVSTIEAARGGAELLRGGKEYPEKLIEAERQQGIVEAIEPQRGYGDEHTEQQPDDSSYRHQEIPCDSILYG